MNSTAIPKPYPPAMFWLETPVTLTGVGSPSCGGKSQLTPVEPLSALQTNLAVSLIFYLVPLDKVKTVP